MVTATIDGIAIEVPSGTTILEAARTIGVHIPTLCHHEDLRPAGVCRICVVGVEGMRTLQTACTTPITQPMTVSTNTQGGAHRPPPYRRPDAGQPLR